MNVNTANGAIAEASLRFVKTVKINGKSLKAVIDAGSAVCTVKATTVLTENFEKERKPSELRGFRYKGNVVQLVEIVREDI